MAALLALMAALAGPSPTSDNWRPARCVVDVAEGQDYAGRCLFHPEGRGSFAISREGDRPLAENIGVISLYVSASGKGEVRGLMKDGVNSRWGEAVRDRKDKACWIGADFRICVYKG